MRRLREWRSRLSGLFSRRADERELADEIESHLQMHTDENIRRGMTPTAARRAARVQLGSVESLKESWRDQRGVPLWDRLGQDLRYALRALKRSPAFTSVAVLTIAFGMAGPTVMFTMAKAWILDPLPFSQPDRLVDLRAIDRPTSSTGVLSEADFLEFRRSARSFEAIGGYRLTDVRLTDVLGGGRAERLRGAQVTTNFFPILGAAAAIGRLFDADDEGADLERAVVISYAMWRERFLSDPNVIGRTMRFGGTDHTVIGVLPEAFQFTLLGRVSVWEPLLFTPEATTNRRTGAVVGLGRLGKGRTVEQARQELTRIADTLAAAYPDTNSRRSVRVMSLADEVRLHHDAGFIVPVLFAMVTCVLLVACVNVTNVMLARAGARRQEMAIRVALGASRARIVRQWLVEHVLVFVVASAVGAALAVYGTSWITESVPYDNRQYLRNYAVLHVDWAVLLFALVVGAVCGAGFGWLPAWTGARADVHADLRDASTKVTAGRVGTRLRAALVVCEVALALALLISAGLLVETARNITRVDVGFDPRSLLTFQLDLDPQRYSENSGVRRFYELLVADLARRPGVTAAAAGSLVPFGTEGHHAEVFFEGQPDPKPAETPAADVSAVTADYANTLRLQLTIGRALDASDTAEAVKVAMVNETLARRFLSGDPIGRRLRLGRRSTDPWTIVGVVRDVKNFEMLDAAEPQVYVPFTQRPSAAATVVVRSNDDPEALIGTVRSTVADLDQLEPVSDVFTMEGRIRRVTGPYQTISSFVLFFGALTLLLAGVGVYGVIAYTFAQRTREIGIRMALGARRADIAALVLKQLRTVLVLGVVPGLALAWLLGHAMEAILVGVTPTDWRLYTAMSLLLMFVAVAAAFVPARRAAAIDPVTALRWE